MKQLFVCLLLLVFGGAIDAQEPQAEPIQIGKCTFSGSIRERVEAWDWFEPAEGQNLYAFSGTIMRFSFSQQKQRYDWKIEMAVPILLGLPNGAVVPAPQGQLGLGGNYYAANEQYPEYGVHFP